MLEIFDSSGRLVRRFSSADQPEPIREKEMNVPVYWAKPPRVLSAEPGMHRWIWDLHYPTPEFPDRDYPISAIPHDTPLDPRGPRALPGTYTVKLTAGNRNFVQQLVVKMDPRVKTSPQGLAQQFKLEMKIANSVNADYQALQQVRAAREQLKKMHGSEQAAGTITVLDRKLATLEGTSGGYSATYFTTPEGVSLARLNAGFQKLYTDIDGADMPPTTEQTTAFNELQRALDADIAKWNDIKAHDLPAIER